MSDLIILSDEEIVDETPVKVLPKKPRVSSDLENFSVIVVEDDPTPPSKVSTASTSYTNIVIPETPISEANIRMAIPATTDSVFGFVPKDLSGIMCSVSETDNEIDQNVAEVSVSNVCGVFNASVADEMLFTPSPPRFLHRKDLREASLEGKSLETTIAEDSSNQFYVVQNKNTLADDEAGTNLHPEKTNPPDKVNEIIGYEHEINLQEKRKKKTGQGRKPEVSSNALEKLQKAAEKAEAAELKKLQNQKKKWESGKYALKSIVAEVDVKVLEQGAIGGHLLTRFSESNLTYRITTNSVENCIIWRLKIPEELSQLALFDSEIHYVLLLYDAEAFCYLVANDAVFDHVSKVRSLFPAYTLCFLTNRLMAYISKREREKYKRPDIDDSWTRPPIEEIMSKLTTHYSKVHYRHCRDEAEVAEHVVGLTCSLASCHFRTKLSRLSVNANGSLIPKECVDKTLIKKSTWLKALVSIPKVQPRFAIAIWKKYPNMKSLLREYMNPSKSVYEKEFLLQDLTVEGLLGSERRVGAVCSKRVYRILMAQSGNILTDDVEDGADQFIPQIS